MEAEWKHAGVQQNSMVKWARRAKRWKRSYMLEVDTIDRIGRLAVELGVLHSPLVDLLLQRALLEVEAGNWQLEATPVAYVVSWRE